jgi:hypothetical protein
MEVDIHLEVAPMPEFVEGASVCLFLYIVNQLVTYDFIRNLRPQTISTFLQLKLLSPSTQLKKKKI